MLLILQREASAKNQLPSAAKLLRITKQYTAFCRRSSARNRRATMRQFPRSGLQYAARSYNKVLHRYS